MTIGIIEDDTLLHQALKTALQNAGYQTVSAYTKQEALTTITGSESLFSLTLDFRTAMDLHVTKRSGKRQRYRLFS